LFRGWGQIALPGVPQSLPAITLKGSPIDLYFR
jgi:hypothetical protein